MLLSVIDYAVVTISLFALLKAMSSPKRAFSPLRELFRHRSLSERLRSLRPQRRFLGLVAASRPPGTQSLKRAQVLSQEPESSFPMQKKLEVLRSAQ